MRGEVGVHPGDDIALFHVEIVFVIVVLEDHLGKDAVDLHHAQCAADLYPATLDGQFGVFSPLAALDFVDVTLKRAGAVGLCRDPDLVAVQVTHHAHIRVVCQRVLGDE